MTSTQKQQFNRMREALKGITKFQSPEKLRKDSKKDWGLDYEEALEMSYENMQEVAERAVKGVKQIV